MSDDREADVQRERILNPTQIGPYRFTPKAETYAPSGFPFQYVSGKTVPVNSTTFPDVAELVKRIEALEADKQTMLEAAKLQQQNIELNQKDIWATEGNIDELQVQISESGRLLRNHWEAIEGLQERLAIIVSDISDQRDMLGNYRAELDKIDEDDITMRATVSQLRDRLDAHERDTEIIRRVMRADNERPNTPKLDELRVAEDLLALIHHEMQRGDKCDYYLLEVMVKSWEILVKNATP